VLTALALALCILQAPAAEEVAVTDIEHLYQPFPTLSILNVGAPVVLLAVPETRLKLTTDAGKAAVVITKLTLFESPFFM